jgi:hypothetical protein
MSAAYKGFLEQMADQEYASKLARAVNVEYPGKSSPSGGLSEIIPS